MASFAALAETISLETPQQRTFSSPKAVPVVIRCTKPSATASETAEWVTSNQEYLTSQLTQHGAVLFRGFPLHSASDFDGFVGAFRGWADLPYEESLSYAVRLKMAGTARVCTANEGRNGGLIFHHEQAQAPYYPSKIFFYCLARDPSEPGGATAICPSTEVYKRVLEAHPGFISQIRTHGVLYTAVLSQHPEEGAEAGVGRGWDNFFGKTCEDHHQVESRMRELGYTWKWLDGEHNQLQLTTPRLEAIKEVRPGVFTFFNQLPATFANAAEFAKATGAVPNVSDYVCAGDGSALPLEAMEYALKACQETAVEVEWQPGDVALLDNYQVMHARRPFSGNKRKVLVSLTKGEVSTGKARM